MRGMFHWRSSLKELNLNNLNTNSVTDMSFMFRECSSLKELNLNNFNTIIFAYMKNMFRECSKFYLTNMTTRMNRCINFHNTLEEYL